jgi:integrase
MRLHDKSGIAFGKVHMGERLLLASTKRRQHMSVHKTKSGNYRTRWRQDGRQYSKNFKRKIDAEKFLAAVLINEAPATTRNNNSVTLASFAETWIKDYATIHKAPSSLIRDQQVLRDYILPSLGQKKLETIELRDAVKLQGMLSRDSSLSAKSINNVIGQLCKMLSDAVAWGLLKVNPIKGVAPIKCPEVAYRFWTFAERDRFLAYVKSRDTDLYKVVAFAIHTGLRRGEVEGLLRDCVDFDRREIIVRRSYCHKTHQLNEFTKGKKIRRVPMNDAVIAVLADRRLLAPNAKVFDFDFQHFVDRIFKPMQKRAEVGVITFHDLRHSFASHLAMSGLSPFDIQKLLGHSDIKTSMRYMHLAPDHLRGATDLLTRHRPLPQHSERSAINCE